MMYTVEGTIQVMAKPRSARAVLMISMTEILSSLIDWYLKAASRTVTFPKVDIRAEQTFQLASSHCSVEDIDGGSMFLREGLDLYSPNLVTVEKLMKLTGTKATSQL